jgi:hypothetical protein
METSQPTIVKEKLAKRSLSVRKRCDPFVLRGNDVILINMIKRFCMFCIYEMKSGRRDSRRNLIWTYRARWCFNYYLSKKYVIVPPNSLLRPVRLNRSIESFSSEYCVNVFRFEKADLKRLLLVLNFPTEVRFDNRSKMPGEEVFLRGLYELSTGENKYTIAENVFGRHYSDQTRAFIYFISHVYIHFRHLVQKTDDYEPLQWWMDTGLLELSAAKIGHRMGPNWDGFNDYALFIDCNCLPT